MLVLPACCQKHCAHVALLPEIVKASQASILDPSADPQQQVWIPSTLKHAQPTSSAGTSLPQTADRWESPLLAELSDRSYLHISPCFNSD